ncbi:hypothetical protein Gotur_011216 [Gossypium turneri]
MESGGINGVGGDEISLLAEELTQLSVKSSMVEPNEDDLESVMEGQPWLFRKNLIIFDQIFKPIKRDQIRLVSSPFWIKIGPCLPESEIRGEFCRLRIQLNVQKPLRRGIFVSTGNGNKCWIPFKYEKLPTFCFGCGKLGHGLLDCTSITPAEKIRIREDPPYSLALKA